MANIQDVIDVIDFNQPKLKRKLILITAIMCLFIVAVFSIILQLNGFPSLLILDVVPLLIVTTIFHEALHYIPQWYFSKQKPHLGFTFLGPFSALSVGSSITRNQAIFSTLAPTLILTPIILILLLFASLFLRILLLAWACSELATSYGDFYLTYRLLKNPPNSLLRNVNNSNVILRPTN